VSHFFAYLARMKYIRRWGLMRNTNSENIQEHSLQVAMIAHALAVIRNERFAGDVDPARVALLAVFHDAEEVITGDLPTPIKYFNPQIADAVDGLSVVAKQRLLDMIPPDLAGEYETLFFPAVADRIASQLVKAADRICAYLKCLEEAKAGNLEFARAEHQIWQSLLEIDLPEVRVFIDTFIPSFRLTLDELN
jgi:5'-deoxynucleotidase